jgi:hypothetical protein
LNSGRRLSASPADAVEISIPGLSASICPPCSWRPGVWLHTLIRSRGAADICGS